MTNTEGYLSSKSSAEGAGTSREERLKSVLREADKKLWEVAKSEKAIEILEEILGEDDPEERIMLAVSKGLLRPEEARVYLDKLKAIGKEEGAPAKTPEEKTQKELDAKIWSALSGKKIEVGRAEELLEEADVEEKIMGMIAAGILERAEADDLRKHLETPILLTPEMRAEIEKSPLAEAREKYVREEEETKTGYKKKLREAQRWGTPEEVAALLTHEKEEKDAYVIKVANAKREYEEALQKQREKLHAEALQEINEKGLSGKEAADAFNAKIAEIIVKTVVEEGDALYTQRMKAILEDKGESAAKKALNAARSVGEWYRKQPLKRKLIVSGALLAGTGVSWAIAGTVGAGVAAAVLTGQLTQRTLAGLGAGIATEAGLERLQERRTKTKTLKEFTRKIHVEAAEGKDAATLGAELLEALNAQNIDLDNRMNKLGGTKKTAQKIWRGAAGAAVAGAIIFGIPAKIARAQEMREAAGAAGEYAGKAWHQLTESLRAGKSVREAVQGGLAKTREWIYGEGLEKMEVEVGELKGRKALSEALTKAEKAARELEETAARAEAKVLAAEKLKVETANPPESIPPEKPKVNALKPPEDIPVKPPLEMIPEYAKLAEIKKGEGMWHAVERQLRWQLAHKSPEEFAKQFGLKVEDIKVNPEKTLDRATWKILNEQGYIKPKGGAGGEWVETRIAKPGVRVFLGEDGKVKIGGEGKLTYEWEKPKAAEKIVKAEKPKLSGIGAEKEAVELAPESRAGADFERTASLPKETPEGKTPETGMRPEEAMETSKPPAGGEEAFGEREPALAPEEGAGAAPESIGEVKPLTVEQLPKLNEEVMLENEQTVRKMLGFGAEEYAALKNEKVGDFLNKISSAEEGWDRWRKGEFGNISRSSMRERIKLAGLINRLRPAGSMQRLTISQFLQMVGPKRFT